MDGAPDVPNRMFRMQLQQRANDTLKSNGSSSFSPPYDKGAPQYTKKASLIQVYQLYSHLFIPFYLFSFLKKNGFTYCGAIFWCSTSSEFLQSSWWPVATATSVPTDWLRRHLLRFAQPDLLPEPSCHSTDGPTAIGYPIRSSFSAQPWLMVPNMWYHPPINIGFYV